MTLEELQQMKPDKQRFILDIYKRCRNGYTKKEGITPRQIINEDNFYMHHKRAWSMLEYFANKGWYEWGVTMDLGWLTPEGIQIATILAKEE